LWWCKLSHKFDFEKSLKRLEEIADQLEIGNIPLEESIKIFEEGIKLSKYCEKLLNTTEQKVDTVNSFEIPKEFLDIETDKKSKHHKIITNDEEPQSDSENFLFK